MPLIREYRVVLPMSVEEYEVARRWGDVKDLQRNLKSAKANPVWHHQHGKKLLLREEVEGIPFLGNLCPKVRAERKVERRGQLINTWNEEPDFLMQAIHFTEALIGWCMLEKIKLTDCETWDAYPYYRFVNQTSNQVLFGKSYEVIMESVCLPGNGQVENALNLPPSILQKRHVCHVDIAANVADADYDSEKDPILYQSVKTGRGPLKPGKWLTSTDTPMMTIYTVITVNFSRCGLSHMAERKLQNRALRGLALYHRHLFCTMDSWIGLPVAELKSQERQLRLQLDTVIEDGMKAHAKLQLAGGGGGDVLVDIGSSVEGQQRQEQEEGEFNPPRETPCSLGMGAALLMCSFVAFGLLLVMFSDNLF